VPLCCRLATLLMHLLYLLLDEHRFAQDKSIDDQHREEVSVGMLLSATDIPLLTVTASLSHFCRRGLASSTCCAAVRTKWLTKQCCSERYGRQLSWVHPAVLTRMILTKLILTKLILTRMIGGRVSAVNRDQQQADPRELSPEEQRLEHCQALAAMAIRL